MLGTPSCLREVTHARCSIVLNHASSSSNSRLELREVPTRLIRIVLALFGRVLRAKYEMRLFSRIGKPTAYLATG